ncbi:hypothetical protein T459_35481 [Capsicum annuum]|uniref:TPX2 C-terminal domain-containing protein n=1 Tax=Capsicum annuum TaxID=4072 RepID=A0A2G2XJ59_CAPAN|nr:hypothetical protein T459_35481 [Capsicum annuum]
MAGGIEEPFRLSFQIRGNLDLSHSVDLRIKLYVGRGLYQFFMKLEEKVHAKEEEMHQLQARTQEKKEAEIKQVRRNLNFKETPMPAFYREPGRRSVKNKVIKVYTGTGLIKVYLIIWNGMVWNFDAH